MSTRTSIWFDGTGGQDGNPDLHLYDELLGGTVNFEIKCGPFDYLTPEHPTWEPTWKALEAIVGDLTRWEYMGPSGSFHCFRLRAGAPGNKTGHNRYAYIPAQVPCE